MHVKVFFEMLSKQIKLKYNNDRNFNWITNGLIGNYIKAIKLFEMPLLICKTVLGILAGIIKNTYKCHHIKVFNIKL